MKIFPPQRFLNPSVAWSEKSLKSSFSGMLSLEHPFSDCLNYLCLTFVRSWSWDWQSETILKLLKTNRLSSSLHRNRLECISDVIFSQRSAWIFINNLMEGWQVQLVTSTALSIQLIKGLSRTIKQIFNYASHFICSILTNLFWKFSLLWYCTVDSWRIVIKSVCSHFLVEVFSDSLQELLYGASWTIPAEPKFLEQSF